MFWQGGFTFYSAVVVPVGQSVLGSHRKQGLITREVTVYLNLAGTLALAVLAWDIAATADSVTRRRWRGVAWLAMVLAQVFLLWMHGQLSGLLDSEQAVLLDASAFRAGHRWYLWISTIQWGAGVVYAILTLWAWSQEDRNAGKSEIPLTPQPLSPEAGERGDGIREP